MSETVSNRHTLFIVTIFTIILCLGILFMPLYWWDVKWENSISYAGSLASFGAIVIVIIQTFGLAAATESIEHAVRSNKRLISRILSLEEIVRHLQMVPEINSYIEGEQWRLAKLRLYDMKLLLTNLNVQPKKYNLDGNQVSACLSDISEDLRSLNTAIHTKTEIDSLIIANHVEAIGPLLNTVCNHLKNVNYESD